MPQRRSRVPLERRLSAAAAAGVGAGGGFALRNRGTIPPRRAAAGNAPLTLPLLSSPESRLAAGRRELPPARRALQPLREPAVGLGRGPLALPPFVCFPRAPGLLRKAQPRGRSRCPPRRCGPPSLCGRWRVLSALPPFHTGFLRGRARALDCSVGGGTTSVPAAAAGHHAVLPPAPYVPTPHAPGPGLSRILSVCFVRGSPLKARACGPPIQSPPPPPHDRLSASAWASAPGGVSALTWLLTWDCGLRRYFRIRAT